MRKEKKSNSKKTTVNIECANEFDKRHKNPAESHKDIENRSKAQQSKDNFEFSRDNYRYSNGESPRIASHDLLERSNSSYQLDSLRDKNLEDAFEYEIADDLYGTSDLFNIQNNKSNNRNQNNKNQNNNKNNNR